MDLRLQSSLARLLAVGVLWVAALSWPAHAAARTTVLPSPTLADPPPPGTPSSEPRDQTATSRQGSPDETPSEAGAQPAFERFLPELDLLFPEGALDLKFSRLINKVLFEGQVRYAFVSGNITAFLRYRYYGANRTTQLEAFDQINFGRLQNLSSRFERTRGGLVFIEWPRSFGFRTFAMGEVDRISSNLQEFLSTNNLTNTFVRLGTQLGRADDSRSRSIVGDSRAYVPSIFTAVREIGQNQFGFTGALTDGFPLGSFNYLKLEAQALKRFDLTDRTFLVGTLHDGSFLYSQVRNPAIPAAVAPQNRYSIPLGEFFNLGGADNLKGVSSNPIGTQELHTTWELFSPWFLGQHHQVLRTDWQSWYWILYAGLGSLGFDNKTYTNLSGYIPDTGLGFEAAVQLWRYRFFVSGIVARALKGNNHVTARLSVRSFR